MEKCNQNLKAAILEPWFLEAYPDRPVYTVIPERCKINKPVGLFIFMHGGDTDSPPDQPYKTYLNPEKGVLQP